MRRLSTAVDALKRELDNERSRTATLEQRLHKIGQTLPSCPKGYTVWRGTCYKAFKKMKTFSEAAASCREDGGTLAMPRDAGTDAFLISLYKSVSDGRGFWIGLHDQREEGRFEWVDGSALGPYSSWSRGEPSGPLLWGNNSEDCVSYSSRPFQKDKWTDENCSMPNYFICQVASD
ncbi:collectin-10-like [Branchiostoma floridae x Branchiostoma belcheri]